MWSRYVLKRRVDKYQQETRSLLEQHRQSLAYREVRTVKIDCSFLPDSRWGRIGQDPASPAWLLYLDVKISQPKDCSLSSANVEVIFRSHHQESRTSTAGSRLGPIITDYFGPQRIDGTVINSQGSAVCGDATLSLGQGYLMGPMSSRREPITSSSDYGSEWTLRGFSWPLAEDTSGLPRRVEWLVEDAVACGGLRLALVLQHDMKPFSIEVRIDGRLQGEKNKKFRFRRPTEPGNIPNLSSIVTPCGTDEFQLDDIASKLDYEMTRLNIQKYRSAAKMLLRDQDPSSPHPTFCLEQTNRSSISHSDDSQQPRSHSKYTHSDYTVAWICALPIEMAAAKAMLEEIHPNLSVHPSDTNHYVLGQIGSHNIVLACLPNDAYGTTSAAVVATHMLYTFNQIRMGVMVGVGGGVPSTKNDIRLGDVVVSSPTGHFGGVIQHDMGKNIGHKIQMTGALNRPPQSLLVAVARLRTEHLISGNKVPDYVEEMLTENPTMKSDFSCLGPDRDRLFEANYDHVESTATCEKCDRKREIVRPPRTSNSPKIHYGLVASGNQVMRHGLTRDRLAKDLDILCFEMEAAGLMNNFPCLVVRGICDYADSHKSKEWQGYAAATAAGYAKNLLSVISVPQIYSIPVAVTSISGDQV
ncbi:hypothetical protein PENSUB_9633 [Penicillium subrubescens]|uniref:Nucleoside phosphorylase domain-containing protein n=2 Tax=Penicillium subrubescens TaxID=1316194 RepID=A0A1Q5TCV2_9EURO|nr:hypothetical protein PENSUB_9633 [Penicillium subrubescens]